MNEKIIIRSMCWFLLVLICKTGSAEFAGNDSINKLASLYKTKARQSDRRKDIYPAIQFYTQYVQIKPKDIKTTYRLACLYFEDRDYPHAYQYFDSVIHMSRTRFLLVYYYKGIVCMNLARYDESIELLTKFRKIYKENRKTNFRKLAAIYIESASWAKSQPDNPGAIEVFHQGSNLNQSKIEFAPFPLDNNHILYGALKTDDINSSGSIRQIYTATRESGQWKTTGKPEGDINDPEISTGNAVVSGNGQTMYFTRTRKNWQNADICEIFISKLKDGVWQTPEKLPYPVNNENYTSTQPALGKNLRNGADVLFFVSNRPGGKGGLDIWVTEFDQKNNNYKEPQDLDKNVNSPDDECCPFYDLETSTLYFSSKGKKTELGGYDIFKATGTTKKWSEAIPLPKPVNSAYDDYYFSVLPGNKEGFFTSNRPESMSQENGSCCDDIFTFRVNECILVSALGTIRNSTNYDIYDKLNESYHLNLEYPKDSSILPNVPVELYLPGETEKDDILVSNTTTDVNGHYFFNLERNRNYKILVKNYGYFEKRVPVSTIGVNCSDTILIGPTHINYLPRVNFSVNIYYDHDKYDLSDIARTTIDTTLMPLFDLFPNAIIEIGSHTDNTGTDEYNLKLSQHRSESVVNYLISRGISRDRLVAKGYGMRFPVAPNTHIDGSDNPEGRQLNRRTEIKIVGDISSLNQNE